MIFISQAEIFNQIVTDAKAALSSIANEKNRQKRWSNAIDRAVREIEANPFIHWDRDTLTLLICSPSNNIYSTNDICGCIAFQLGQACWHRAASRLVRLYFEAVSALMSETEQAAASGTPLLFFPNTKNPPVERVGRIRVN